MKLTLGSLAAIAALVCCFDTRAAERSPIDPFNVGLDIGTMCDFHPGVPMGESCRTLIAAVVEIEKSYVALDDETRKRLNRACIPPNLTVPQIFEAIRPELRKNVGICAGLCTSTSYVMGSLNAVFPCPPGKQ